MTFLPWPMPEEAVNAAARADYERVDENWEALKATGRVVGRRPGDEAQTPWEELTPEVRERFMASHRVTLEAALPFLRFSPLGDNHHSASACPHCLAELAAALTARGPVLAALAAYRDHMPPMMPGVEHDHAIQAALRAAAEALNG